jgi:hypothetical protein
MRSDESVQLAFGALNASGAASGVSSGWPLLSKDAAIPDAVLLVIDGIAALPGGIEFGEKAAFRQIDMSAVEPRMPCGQ